MYNKKANMLSLICAPQSTKQSAVRPISLLWPKGKMTLAYHKILLNKIAWTLYK